MRCHALHYELRGNVSVFCVLRWDFCKNYSMIRCPSILSVFLSVVLVTSAAVVLMTLRRWSWTQVAAVCWTYRGQTRRTAPPSAGTSWSTWAKSATAGRRKWVDCFQIRFVICLVIEWRELVLISCFVSDLVTWASDGKVHDEEQGCNIWLMLIIMNIVIVIVCCRRSFLKDAHVNVSGVSEGPLLWAEDV